VARKKKHPEHVNHERWLVSYADFITLLFAFFTTLYAISTVDAKKAGKLVFAMRQAFNLDFFITDKAILGLVPPDKAVAELDRELVKHNDAAQEFPTRPKPPPRSKQEGKGKGKGKGRGNADLSALAQVLRRVFSDARLGAHVQLRLETRGLVISLDEVGFFAPGASRLRAESLPLLTRVGELLRDLGHDIRVEGHADERGSEMANWDLSTARSVAVVRHFISKVSFPPARLVAAGYGSHKPVSTNQTPEGRARNRRVDVLIQSPDAAKDDPP
jgi:chemotaxis protein MotB